MYIDTSYTTIHAMPNGFSIRHFILGLLARQPMSGYDIKRFLRPELADRQS
jgi:DNA-binding PadR family transcriptional regulator